LSEETGFTYSDFMSMDAHILIGLWNAKKDVITKRREDEKKQQKSGGDLSGMVSMPSSMSGMLSAAKGLSSGSVKMPSMPSGMPSISSFHL
jgi:hypothetical protein